MLQIKGYKSSKRCSTYFKKMISRGIWKVNERISTIGQISDKLGISEPTVRQVIKQFERSGILKNWGSLGFYLTTNSIKKIPPVSKNAQYLNIFKTQLNAFDLLNSGAIRIRNWILRYQKIDDSIIGLNEVSGLILRTTLDEIYAVSAPLISLESILKIKNPTLFEEKINSFNRQRELLPIMKLVLRYKKELGIHG